MLYFNFLDILMILKRWTTSEVNYLNKYLINDLSVGKQYSIIIQEKRIAIYEHQPNEKSFILKINNNLYRQLFIDEVIFDKYEKLIRDHLFIDKKIYDRVIQDIHQKTYYTEIEPVYTGFDMNYNRNNFILTFDAYKNYLIKKDKHGFNTKIQLNTSEIKYLNGAGYNDPEYIKREIDFETNDDDSYIYTRLHKWMKNENPRNELKYWKKDRYETLIDDLKNKRLVLTFGELTDDLSKENPNESIIAIERKIYDLIRSGDYKYINDHRYGRLYMTSEIYDYVKHMTNGFLNNF